MNVCEPPVLSMLQVNLGFTVNSMAVLSTAEIVICMLAASSEAVIQPVSTPVIARLPSKHNDTAFEIHACWFDRMPNPLRSCACVSLSVCLCLCFPPACGNGRCEVGEACMSAECDPGCPLDCPPYLGPCPVAQSSNGAAMTCSGVGTCTPGSAQCVCFAGYAGPACSDCDASGYLRVVSGGPCVFIPGTLGTCSDGVKNGNEVGVDCGGPNCSPCPTRLPTYLRVAAYSTASVAVVAVLLVMQRLMRRALESGRASSAKAFSRKVAAVFPAPPRPKHVPVGQPVGPAGLTQAPSGGKYERAGAHFSDLSAPETDNDDDRPAGGTQAPNGRRERAGANFSDLNPRPKLSESGDDDDDDDTSPAAVPVAGADHAQASDGKQERAGAQFSDLSAPEELLVDDVLRPAVTSSTVKELRGASTTARGITPRALDPSQVTAPWKVTSRRGWEDSSSRAAGVTDGSSSAPMNPVIDWAAFSKPSSGRKAW